MTKTELFNSLDSKIVEIAQKRNIELTKEDRKELVFHLACFKIDGRTDTYIDSLAEKFVGMCA